MRDAQYAIDFDYILNDSLLIGLEVRLPIFLYKLKIILCQSHPSIDNLIGSLILNEKKNDLPFVRACVKGSKLKYDLILLWSESFALRGALVVFL